MDSERTRRGRIRDQRRGTSPETPNNTEIIKTHNNTIDNMKQTTHEPQVSGIPSQGRETNE